MLTWTAHEYLPTQVLPPRHVRVAVFNCCRDLVSDDAFVQKEFAFSKEPTRRNNLKPSKFNVLTPGKSAAADKLLKWLDGISDALGKGWLESTQLSIIPSKQQPEHVIESYTFTFGYGTKPTDTQSSREVSSLNISQNCGASITVQSARHELGKLIRYLVQLCQTLPELPSKLSLCFYQLSMADCVQRRGT